MDLPPVGQTQMSTLWKMYDKNILVKVLCFGKVKEMIGAKK